MKTLTKKQKDCLIQHFTAPMAAAKEQFGQTAGGCGFSAADAVMITHEQGTTAYDAAVNILHEGMKCCILNSRLTRYRGKRLLALKIEPELNGKPTPTELWFDVSAIRLSPETAIEDEDELYNELADTVYYGSLGQLLFLLDDTCSRTLKRHTRYNLYSSDQNELGLLYAAVANPDIETLGILLTRTSLSVDTCDEEAMSLVRFAYAHKLEDMIELLKKHGLDADYDPKNDPGYAYYLDEYEEYDDEEEDEEWEDDEEDADDDEEEDGN